MRYKKYIRDCEALAIGGEAATVVHTSKCGIATAIHIVIVIVLVVLSSCYPTCPTAGTLTVASSAGTDRSRSEIPQQYQQRNEYHYQLYRLQRCRLRKHACKSAETTDDEGDTTKRDDGVKKLTNRCLVVGQPARG